MRRMSKEYTEEEITGAFEEPIGDRKLDVIFEMIWEDFANFMEHLAHVLRRHGYEEVYFKDDAGVTSVDFAFDDKNFNDEDYDKVVSEMHDAYEKIKNNVRKYFSEVEMLYFNMVDESGKIGPWSLRVIFITKNKPRRVIKAELDVYFDYYDSHAAFFEFNPAIYIYKFKEEKPIEEMLKTIGWSCA